MSKRPAPGTEAAGVTFVLGTTAGGTGRHVRSLAAGLAARGIDVAVCGPAETEPMLGFTSAGARFAAVEIGDRPRPARDLAAAARLRRVLREYDTAADKSSRPRWRGACGTKDRARARPARGRACRARPRRRQPRIRASPAVRVRGEPAQRAPCGRRPRSAGLRGPGADRRPPRRPGALRVGGPGRADAPPRCAFGGNSGGARPCGASRFRADGAGRAGWARRRRQAGSARRRQARRAEGVRDAARRRWPAA